MGLQFHYEDGISFHHILTRLLSSDTIRNVMFNQNRWCTIWVWKSVWWWLGWAETRCAINLYHSHSNKQCVLTAFSLVFMLLHNCDTILSVAFLLSSLVLYYCGCWSFGSKRFHSIQPPDKVSIRNLPWRRATWLTGWSCDSLADYAAANSYNTINVGQLLHSVSTQRMHSRVII
jgi:hypothetical protein